jgi:hypothetical protein
MDYRTISKRRNKMDPKNSNSTNNTVRYDSKDKAEVKYENSWASAAQDEYPRLDYNQATNLKVKPGTR